MPRALTAALPLLLSFVVVTTAAARPGGLSPLDRVRQNELRKRLGLARHQLQSGRATQNAELYVKGRLNRAQAAHLQVKLWRSQASNLRTSAGKLATEAPERQGLEQRAARLLVKAGRLSIAARTYGAGTESFRASMIPAGGQPAAPVQESSPISQLWIRPYTEQERQITGTHASQRLSARLQRIEALTYSRPMRPHEVQDWLRRLPGTGRHQLSQSEPGPGGSEYQWKIVRTGQRNGRPQGYVWSSVTDPGSGERTVQMHSDRLSWARRSLGKDQVTTMVYHRHQLRPDGSIRIPAGTLITVSRAELGRNQSRVMAVGETLDGDRWEQTRTTRPDGSREQFSSTRARDGRILEGRVMLRPDGSWEAIERSLDAQGLQERRTNSAGRDQVRAISDATVERLMRKKGKAYEDPAITMSQHAKGKWRFRQQVPEENGSLGVVSAHGQDGKLGGIRSGYVSPLGMRYGEVDQQLRSRVQPPGAADRLLKSRTYDRRSRTNEPLPEEPTAAALTDADRQRVLQAEQIVNRTRREPMRVLLDDAAGQHNAYAQPWDNKVFARTGPGGAQLKTVHNDHLARVGSGMARSSLATLVGVIHHEGGHESQQEFLEKLVARQTTRLYNMSRVGRAMEREVANLVQAELLRMGERGADRTAGRGQADARKQSGDPQMTPADLVKTLTPPKGTPFKKVWTPYSGYESLRDRSRTMWKAYGKALER